MKRNRNLKLLFEVKQISHMRANCIPKCHNVLVKWSLFTNRRVIKPCIVIAQCLSMSISLPLLGYTVRSESERSRNLIQVKTIAFDKK